MGRLRLPAHRESSATLAGAYPFLVAPAPNTGVPIGTDALTGSVFAFDPWTLYTAGVLTNPNMLLAGVIGQGKSALAKSLGDPLDRRRDAGSTSPETRRGNGRRSPTPSAGRCWPSGPGSATGSTPSTPPTGTDPTVARAGQLALLGALAETALDRALAPVEHTLIGAALTAATAAGGVPTMRGLVDALADPDPRTPRELRWSAGEYRAAVPGPGPRAAPPGRAGTWPACSTAPPPSPWTRMPRWWCSTCPRLGPTTTASPWR